MRQVIVTIGSVAEDTSNEVSVGFTGDKIALITSDGKRTALFTHKQADDLRRLLGIAKIARRTDLVAVVRVTGRVDLCRASGGEPPGISASSIVDLARYCDEHTVSAHVFTPEGERVATINGAGEASIVDKDVY